MKQILLLLPGGFELLEAAAFIDVFGWNQVAGDKSIRLLCGGKDSVIPTSFGHSMQADLLLEDVDPTDFAALALPGGFARFGYFDTKDDDTVMSLIRAFDLDNKPIAAVCTGSLLLAEAGILKGKKATTYAQEQGRWQKQLQAMGVKLTLDSPYIDGNIITSSDPASAIDVSLSLLAMVTDKKNAANVADMMGYKKDPED